MFEAISSFVETMAGLWRAISTGIKIGNIDDGGDLFGGIMQSAHLGAWDDIINNGGLNDGQLVMAFDAQDAGSEYIDNIGIHEWSMEDYTSSISGNIDGFEGISQVTEQAATSVNHAVISSTTGLTGWLDGLEEGI